ncbi:MAG: hypothetical protein DME17_19860 [Candidatus Rokuibacteriota bacterium]|nr:MAG: hypothetical protein DME17_19860 [Candidatus Rokubacteria bacterium]
MGCSPHPAALRRQRVVRGTEAHPVSWIGYALLSAVLAGLVAILGKIGVRGVDSTLATTVRGAIMFGALLAVALARGTLGDLWTVDRRAMLYIALSGLAGAGSWLCYFRALQVGDALRVAPVDRLSGAVTLVLASGPPHVRRPPLGRGNRAEAASGSRGTAASQELAGGQVWVKGAWVKGACC